MSAETRHEEERLIGDGQEDYGSTERGQDQSNIVSAKNPQSTLCHFEPDPKLYFFY